MKLKQGKLIFDKIVSDKLLDEMTFTWSVMHQFNFWRVYLEFILVSMTINTRKVDHSRTIENLMGKWGVLSFSLHIFPVMVVFTHQLLTLIQNFYFIFQCISYVPVHKSVFVNTNLLLSKEISYNAIQLHL